MKVILIEQASADMKWDARYDSASFERAVQEEINSSAAAVEMSRSDASAYCIYTGTSAAARETAGMLFDRSEIRETSLLDDVTLRPFRKTDKKYPLRIWKVFGKAQWYVGSSRQAESRRETMKRAGQFASLLEEEGKDSIVITRGFAMRALKSALRKRGYCIEGGGMFSKPLDRCRATKRSLHCGGCAHNCLLSNPGCGIGISKAREMAQKS